ncbi:MAG: helix-turn-helix domain-containing protein [Treponemataceae bacterium]
MESFEAIRPFDVFSSRCPSREAFERIFSRWGLLVLARLSVGELRFGELHRAIDGISERMLSQTLRTLEDEGLVERREWDEKPPRVDYRLSEAGERISRSIAVVIQDLYAEMERMRRG